MNTNSNPSGVLHASTAVMVAGAMVAAAIMVADHWQAIGFPGGGVLMLDRWTGKLTLCQAANDGAPLAAGKRLACEAQ